MEESELDKCREGFRQADETVERLVLMEIEIGEAKLAAMALRQMFSHRICQITEETDIALD